MKGILGKISSVPVVLGLQVIASVVLVYFILNLNILPFRYVLIIIAVLLVLLGLMALLMRKPKKQPKHAKGSSRVSAAKIISVLLSVVMFVGSAFVARNASALSKVTGDNTTTTAISLVVMKDSSYEKAKDLEDKTIGINPSVNEDNIQTGISKLKKEISYNEEDYDSFADMGDDLYDGKIDAILIDYAYATVIEADHEYFESDTRIIWTYEITEENESTDSDKDVTSNTWTFYISGVDSRGSLNATCRSDVNMILTINPESKQILMTSIPRDYYVTLANAGQKDKLTHSGLFGTDNVVKTVENFMDIDIDYYGRVNFVSVVDIVDALGGIKVYSDKSFTPYTNRSIKISKGWQTMDGEHALAFARERYAYASGDAHRVANQQAVLKAIINKMISPAILKSYTKILDAIEDSFSTTISDDDIKELVKMQLDDGAEWDFQSSTLTGTGKMMTGGYMIPNRKLYYCIPDEDSIKENRGYIEKMLSGEKLDLD